MIDKIKKEQLQIPITFEETEVIDERFTNVKIYLMHTNLNLNNSYFEKSIVDKYTDTLKNTPILGYIVIDENNEKDFEGHKNILVVKNGEFTLKYAGQAFGVIPENCNPRWEMKMCDDGVEREFLVCDGILWSGKFDDVKEIFERDKSKKQSMELSDDFDGFFHEDGYFVFTRFSFYGACALGDLKTEAMTGASIETEFSIDEIKSEIQKNMELLKNTLSKGGDDLADDKDSNKIKSTKFNIGQGKQNLEGGNNVEDKLKLLEKYNFTQEQLKEKEINFKEISLEDLEAKLQEFAKVEPNNQSGQDFELTAMQLVSELDNILAKEKYIDKWGWESRAYWYVDHTDEFVVAEDSQDRYNLVKFDYTVDGDKVSIDFNSKRRAKVEYPDLEVDVQFEFNIISKQRQEYELQREIEEVKKSFDIKETEEYKKLNSQFTEVKEENDKYKNMFENMKSEFEDLKSYKDKTEKIKKEGLFTEFEGTLSEDEMKELKDKMNELAFEVIQKELFALAGQKAVQFSKEGKSSIGVTFEKVDDKPKSTRPYADLIEKHRKNKK